jgi:outer membrane protein
MKNFTLALNVVLVIAVGILFYLHFSSNGKTGVKTDKGNVPSGDFRIAYFEIDSIEAHFDYYKEVSNSIQAKAQENTKQLNQLKEAFASKYQDLQRTAQTMTQAEVNNKQQELMQMEKTYNSKEQMMNNEMQDVSMKKMLDVRQKITDYLKEFNANKGYAYIVANSSESLSFYYKDTAYDITNEIIKGLNERYKKQ